MDYSADYRRYVPILFNFLTFAFRGQSSLAIGRDEGLVSAKYIARADYVRGYDREQFYSQNCGGAVNDNTACSATELLGSRVAFANAELRFPLDSAIRPRPAADLAPAGRRTVLLRHRAGVERVGRRYHCASPRTTTSERSATRCAATAWAFASTSLASHSCGGTTRSRSTAPGEKGYWQWTLGQIVLSADGGRGTGVQTASRCDAVCVCCGSRVVARAAAVRADVRYDHVLAQNTHARTPPNPRPPSPVSRPAVRTFHRCERVFSRR